MGKIINLPVKRKLKINPEENTVVVGDCIVFFPISKRKKARGNNGIQAFFFQLRVLQPDL